MYRSYFLLLLVLISLSQGGLSWGWFPSFTTWNHQNFDHSRSTEAVSGELISEFSMETPNNQKALELIENIKKNLVSMDSCMRNAYGNLFAACSQKEIITDIEKQSRLAWHLSDCFQKDSGRSPFPPCNNQSPMVKCLKNLDEVAHNIYLGFFLRTNSICRQLQSDAFMIRTERLVNDLKKSAEFTEYKLENIEQSSEKLLHNSNQIHDSLTSIDFQTQQIAQNSKDVEGQIDVVLERSKAISEQSKEIVASQLELHQGQTQMREKMEAGMELLNVSYESLGQEIKNLRNEAIEIEKEINEVGEAMSLKMNSLQSKADVIGSVAETSLDNQKQLIDGQTKALKDLDLLANFQSKALEESRDTLQKLTEFSHKQQEELLQRQQQLQQAHDNLAKDSKSTLAAQEAFKAKQASMFMALDKLYTLHNAILLESRYIKAFFFYSVTIFGLYMFTNAKQTYYVRARLYLGLCATFLIEFTIIRFGGDDLGQQNALASKVLWVRSSFLLLASLQILNSIFTYRDYEVLNHQMLLNLIEKINSIERNKMLSLDMESDVNLSSWINTDISEDADDCVDPDYMLPEEVGENSISTTVTRKYDLRPRIHR